MKLSIIRNEIIPVYSTDLGNKVVVMSELHAALGVVDKKSDWFKRKIKEHKLVENKDYCLISDKSFASDKTEAKKQRGGHNKQEFLILLHPAKIIALGTNTDAGHKIKEYFIRCEAIVKNIASGQAFDPSNYVGADNQKKHVKQVAGVLFSQHHDSIDVIKHHQDNCEVHFGKKPSELRKDCVKNGMRVKSKSARDIARMIKPEAACSMAVHDEFVSQGHSIEKLKEVHLKEKLEPAFKVVMDLGFTPTHLLK